MCAVNQEDSQPILNKNGQVSQLPSVDLSALKESHRVKKRHFSHINTEENGGAAAAEPFLTRHRRDLSRREALPQAAKQGRRRMRAPSSEPIG